MSKKRQQSLADFILETYGQSINFSKSHKGSFWFEIDGEKYEYFESVNKIYGDGTSNSPEKFEIEDIVNEFIKSIR